MIDRFEEILRDFSIALGIPLHPDQRGACAIQIEGALEIQLEYQQERDRLLMASFLCEVPPGKFREEVFKAALMHNDQHCVGPLLAYSGRNNQLALYQYLLPPQQPGSVLAELFHAFVAQATQWKTGIASGSVHLLISSSASIQPRPFGL